jgi:hypothetical protein
LTKEQLESLQTIINTLIEYSGAFETQSDGETIEVVEVDGNVITLGQLFDAAWALDQAIKSVK